jgi:hypothetical protein
VKKQKLVIKRLIWNEKNSAHIALHNILPSEVEEVCYGERIERKGHKNRVFLVGSTQQGRMLSVILDPTDEKEVYFPVTAYDASKRSIKDYEDEKRVGGEEVA